ncbi:MAG TPA: dienelactone hydrolase family protein [Baekduia sp.]|nr:dienelactone hydrolase family protein [Baekduia sp.]
MPTLTEQEITLAASAGPMRVFVCEPGDDGPSPAAVMLMDGPGYREELKDAARRLAGEGYRVVLPDLYHRFGGVSFDVVKLVAGDAEELERMVAVAGSLTDAMAVEDTSRCLEFLGDDRVVLVGFCQGARFAIRAIEALGDRIAAASLIHPSFIVTEDASSPHLALGGTACPLYFGFGGADTLTDPDVVPQAVEAHLATTSVPYEIDVLEGGEHGFMVAGPTFHPHAAERAWQGTLRAFGRQ